MEFFFKNFKKSEGDGGRDVILINNRNIDWMGIWEKFQLREEYFFLKKRGKKKMEFSSLQVKR